MSRRTEGREALVKPAAGRLSLHSSMHPVSSPIEVAGPMDSGPDSSKRPRDACRLVTRTRCRGDAKATAPDARDAAEAPRSRRFAAESHRGRRDAWRIDWSHRDCGATVQLQPRRPPGRADRKAAAYGAEIVRLRTEGYTYDSIREALADVGIELSASALRREVRRQQTRLDAAAAGVRPPWRVPAPLAPPVPRALATGSPPSTGTTGREIAEAFFDAHPSNPLFRSRETA